MLDQTEINCSANADTIVISFKDKEIECLRSKFEEQQQYIMELLNLLRQEEETLKRLMSKNLK